MQPHGATFLNLLRGTNHEKTLAIALAALLPAAALADTPGFYVQGDLGHATVKYKEDGDSLKTKGFSPRLSAGYDFGDFRVAADYTHYKKYDETLTDQFGTDHFEAKAHSIGVSGIYDFDTGTPVKPYVGARIGINRISLEATETAPGFYEKESYSKTKLGLGAMVGASYDISDNIALDAGYRYNHWGKFDGVKVHSNEFHGGVRVKF